MTDVADFLEHYGVKGMQWGVRRAQKKAARADRAWQDNVYSVRGAIAVHNAVADRMNNGEIDRLNARHRSTENDRQFNDFFEPQNASARRYINDYTRLTERLTREAVDSVHGVSPSGTLRARLSGDRIVVESVDATHADDVLPTMIFEINVDANDFVTSFRKVRDSMAQSDNIEYFLEHFGVRGMRWGVRKQKNSSPDSRETNPNRSRNIKRAAVATGVGAVIIGGLVARNRRTSMRQAAAAVQESRLFSNNVRVDTILRSGGAPTRDTFLGIMGGNNPRRLQEHVGMNDRDFDSWLSNYSSAVRGAARVNNAIANGDESALIDFRRQVRNVIDS